MADRLDVDFALINRKRAKRAGSSTRAGTRRSSYSGLNSSLSSSGHAHLLYAGGRNGADSVSSLAGTDVLPDDATPPPADEDEERMEILVGDVKGKNAILIDDMADTGETITLAAKELSTAGAKAVYAVVTHGPSPRLPRMSDVADEREGLLSGDAAAALNALPLVRLVVTNTVCQNSHKELAQGKLEVMDVAPLLAESIRRVRLVCSRAHVWS